MSQRMGLLTRWTRIETNKNTQMVQVCGQKQATVTQKMEIHRLQGHIPHCVWRIDQCVSIGAGRRTGCSGQRSTVLLVGRPGRRDYGSQCTIDGNQMCYIIGKDK